MADATLDSQKNSPKRLVESGLRLSDSLIWNLQSAFYGQEGIDAWRKGVVPSYITSNAFIAQRYARVIHRFLLDVQAKSGTPSQPIPIIELGAGHGRFSFLCLRHLLEVDRLSPIKAPPFVYIMTDLADANVQFWEAHDGLQPMAEGGVLDFATFDGDTQTEIHLRKADRHLRPGEGETPVVVIANYVLDSLKQDIYRIAEGELNEGKVLLRANGEGKPDFSDPSWIERLEIHFEHDAIEEDPYEDPSLNEILHNYARELGDTSFCFPVGAFRCLDRLSALSDGQLFLISADKGHNHAHQLLNHGDPSLVLHGSFSFSVNYHALGEWFEAGGGVAMHTSERWGNLEVSAFLRKGAPQDYPLTCLAFQEQVEAFGPLDFFHLRQGVETALAEGEGQLPLAACLAEVRLSGYDPTTFYELREPIRDQAADASAEVQRELARVMRRVWDNFYPLGEDRDLPFAVGRIYHRMSQYHQAIQAYQRSIALLGEDRATYYNIGLCMYRMGQAMAGLHYFEKALVIDPNYAYARDWKLKVQAEMKEGEPTWG